MTLNELAKQGRWTIKSVVDLGSIAGKCEACGTGIRYEYHVRRVEGGDEKVVGSTCGPLLMESSWSMAYWVELQAKFENELGRQMTPEEISAKKAEVSKAEWKRMAKEYLAKQATEKTKELETMLGRYVALRPWHRFAASIFQQIKGGRKLSEKQAEVACGMIAETDWDKLEAEAKQPKPVGERVLSPEEREMDPREPDLLNRMNAVFSARAKLQSWQREMVESFMGQLTKKGGLSEKQLAMLAKFEAALKGAAPVPPAAPVPQAEQSKSTPPEEMVKLASSCAALNPRQMELVKSFGEQLKSCGSLSPKQMGILEDIFLRTKAKLSASAAESAQEPAVPAKKSYSADDVVDDSSEVPF